MEWESRIISNDALAAYSNQPFDDLADRVAALIDQQQATWPLLQKATDALQQVQYKELQVKGSRVLAQFNPARIVSTAAKVDAASIQQRPCFLCAENLPPEEKGIPFGENYVILCNPFPVLKNHLVISEKRHIPQAIADKFIDFLDLTKELGNEYFTLYNGPACGASAPDHHHFQACSRENVPVFSELRHWPRNVISETEDLKVFSPADYRVNILVACGQKKDRIAAWFGDTLTRLAQETSAPSEPMLNLIATWDAQQWKIFLFPRSNHRPSRYYAEGDEKLTISPAGIDLAGVLVVPDPAHFARVTAQDVEQIYSEVSLKI